MGKVCISFLHFIVFLHQISADEYLGQIHIEQDYEALLLECAFPDSFPLTLEYKDVKIGIHLYNNKDFNTPAPVYIMSSKGKAVKERLLSEESSVAYHDKNKMAAIVITCSRYHQSKRPFTLEGKIVHGGIIINIEPLNRYRRDTNQFNVYRFSSPTHLNGIDIDSHMIRVQQFLRQPRKRMKERIKRQSRASEYKVDVLIVTDYTIFDNWFELAPHPNPVIKRLETLTNIRKYYTVAYNWVNLIFQNFPARDYHIQAFITGIIISENKNTSFLTEPYRNGTTIWGLEVLRNMVDWVKNTTKGDIPQHDHIQLFSRLDFTADKALKLRGNKGKSYTGSLCKTNSVSYVEELGGFNSADIAAHELTHSLGASHDGDNNWCSSDTRNLMAIYFNPTVARSNIPSDCTLYDVRIYMRLQTRRNPGCTLERFNVSNDVHNMDGLFPGMVYEADAQCQQIHGPTSFHCRNYLAYDGNEFCESSLFCYDPIKGLCDMQVPALGTPCANKSWCMDTKCIYDDRAPSRESKCLFGDLPVGYYNLTETGESCEQRVKSAPFECYDEFFRRMCCKSCARIKRQSSDCEYGDYISNCYGPFCGRTITEDGEEYLYDFDCCETCATPLTSTLFSTLIESRSLKKQLSTSMNISGTETEEMPTTTDQNTEKVYPLNTTIDALVELSTRKKETTAYSYIPENTISTPYTSIRPEATIVEQRTSSYTTQILLTSNTTQLSIRYLSTTTADNLTNNTRGNTDLCEDLHHSECSTLHKYGADCSKFVNICYKNCTTYASGGERVTSLNSKDGMKYRKIASVMWKRINRRINGVSKTRIGAGKSRRTFLTLPDSLIYLGSIPCQRQPFRV